MTQAEMRQPGPGASAAPARSAPPADALQVAGLVPLSTVDWPGRLVATVFCQGCPWRCAYCHNQQILTPVPPGRDFPGRVPFDDLRALLGRRNGLLDGVVFSGGEATSQSALLPAVQEVRELGFAVGLHTGGAYPARLAALLGCDGDGRRVGEPLLAWVGFDVKAPPGRYAQTVGRPGAWERAGHSLALLLDSGIDHELRMTLTPRLAGSVADVIAMLTQAGGRSLVLQQARADGAPPAFQREVAEAGDWDACFAEAAQAAQAAGERRGVEVTVRG